MDRPNGVRTERAGLRGRVKTRRRATENNREDILRTDRRRRPRRGFFIYSRVPGAPALLLCVQRRQRERKKADPRPARNVLVPTWQTRPQPRLRPRVYSRCRRWRMGCPASRRPHTALGLMAGTRSGTTNDAQQTVARRSNHTGGKGRGEKSSISAPVRPFTSRSAQKPAAGSWPVVHYVHCPCAVLTFECFQALVRGSVFPLAGH